MSLLYTSKNGYIILNMNDKHKLDILCLQALAYVIKRSFTESLMIKQAVKPEISNP